MSKIRVLEVIRQGQIGGGESHLLDLIAGFSSEVEPIVLSFTSGQMIDQLTSRGVNCKVIDTGRAFDLGVIRSIDQLIYEEKIELVHAHGSRAASNMLFSCYQSKKPLLYTVHGWSFHPDQNPLVQKLRVWSEHLICHRSVGVICVSESNRKTGVDRFGLKHAQVIENGVNLKRFEALPRRMDTRSSLGFNDTDFVMGFVGRMTLQKDPLTFLKALKLASAKNSRVKGLLVGDGEMNNEVHTFIRENQMENDLVSTGYRTDIPEMLSAMDVFCLPSLWEGLSIALLEAMASAVSVIVTPTDGAREIIRDGKNGYLVDFKKPEEIAEKVLELLKQPEKKADMALNAQKMIYERFDSQRVSQRVECLYSEIIGKWKQQH
jgi:glycosyltransferase involved in cell wall biosynthesis